MSGSHDMKPAGPRMKLTYDDYLLFPDDGKRHELIDGEPLVTPTPILRHSGDRRQTASANRELPQSPADRACVLCAARRDPLPVRRRGTRTALRVARPVRRSSEGLGERRSGSGRGDWLAEHAPTR